MRAIVTVEKDSIESRKSKATGNEYRLQLMRYRGADMPQFRDVLLFVPRDLDPLPVGTHHVEVPVKWRDGKLEVGFPQLVKEQQARVPGTESKA